MVRDHPKFKIHANAAKFETYTCQNPDCGKRFERKGYFRKKTCSHECGSRLSALSRTKFVVTKRNMQAYMLRRDRLSWEDIAQELRFKNDAFAVNGARRHALRNWYGGGLSNWGTVGKSKHGGYVRSTHSASKQPT